MPTGLVMKMLQRFCANQSANVGVIFALALIPVATGLGAAIDYSRAANARVALQTLADAAALASAASSESSDSARKAVAMAFFDANRLQDPNLMSNAAASVSLTNNSVTVTSQGVVAASILNVIGISQIPVSVTSTAARTVDGPPVCILALNRTANDAIAFSGGTGFVGENCAIYSNSSSASAISIAGSASVKSAGMCAYGGVSDSVGSAQSH
jgi:Flp pilus assembly protein TadG